MPFGLADLSLMSLALACGAAVLAGFVKGIVGFAMPTVLISLLGSFLSPELALAGLILPTLVTNGFQALRQGGAAAWSSARRFRVFLLAGFVCLVLSAQLVVRLPASVIYALIGVPVCLFAALQLAGLRLVLPTPTPRRVEAAVGAVTGFIGGISGIWGPPTVMYLTAIGTEKRDQMRIQGVIYGLGALALVGAHLASGIVTAETARFSASLIPPALLGMWIGGRVQDRIDQTLFRRLTLLVLLIAGLNLLRRAASA